MDFDIIEVLCYLKEERTIFTSEADFKYALAKTIEKTYPNKAKVRLEYCPETVPNMHIDFLVLWYEDGQRKWIPIELKYKTKEYCWNDDDGCIYNLKNHRAYPENRQKYKDDIIRINTIASIVKDKYKTGFAIFLTNDSLYSNGESANVISQAEIDRTDIERETLFTIGIFSERHEPNFQYFITEIKPTMKVNYEKTCLSLH